MDEGTRASLHCGYLDRERWASVAELPAAFGGQPYTVDVCPGHVGGLPSVIEGAHATMAFKNGALDQFYPELENIMIEAAATGMRAFNLYEHEQIKKAAKPHG